MDRSSAKSSGTNNKQGFHERSLMKPRGEVRFRPSSAKYSYKVLTNRSLFLLVNIQFEIGVSERIRITFF